MSHLIIENLSEVEREKLAKTLKPKLNQFIPHTPTPKQSAFLLLQDSGTKKPIEAFFGGAAGGGKILANDGIVLTLFGWKKGEHLKVGDLINNPDGTIQRIIQIKSEVTLPRWRVHFSDKTYTDVAEDHLWLSWKGHKSRKLNNIRTFGIDSAEVVETKTLLDWINRGYNPQIPLCKEQPFNGTTKEKNRLDPYLLGVILGDGCTTQSNIQITCNKEDSGHYLNLFGPKDINGISYKTVRFTGEFNKYLKTKLKLYGLLGTKAATKFIPKQYKLGSIVTRYRIIQGLMDTDGYNDKKDNGCYYCTISERLSEDVAFILRSLGAMVTITNKIGQYRNEDGNIVKCSKVYTLYIKHRDKDKLFSLERKFSNKVNTDISKRVTKVEVCGEITGRCITVSNPNGLYITDDFIVTHNSDALLMASLQHTDIAGYSAILFRRTFSELALPGSLMTRCHEWLYPHKEQKKVHWSEQKKTYTFYPSGATITFGYLENVNDHFRYQSAEFQTICFDELTHFEMSDYTYLFSRLRRTKVLEEAGVPLRMLSASNPGGAGAGWVKQRFLTEGSKKGRVFIPATLNDNPYLDKESYIESLNELSPLERAQLLEGNWDVSAGGQIFKRDWFEILDTLPEVKKGYVPRVRYWDLAATDADVSKAYGYKPAFTVGLRMAKYKDLNGEDLFIIEDVVRFQKTPDDVERKIKEVTQNDGRATDVWMEQEPGSSGVKVIIDYRKSLQGFSFRGMKETGSKILRANRVSSTAGHGRIKLLKGIWNNDFLDEVDFFPNQKIKDQVDCLSGAYDKLAHYASYSVIPTAVGQEQESYWQQA